MRGPLLAAALLPLLAAAAAHAQRANSIVEWDGESTYHFTPRRTYLHHKRSVRRVVEEKDIAGNWGCVTAPVDAAVRFDNRKVYLFFGSRYARYDMDRNACDPGYPKAIGGGWPGLPWSADLDAAVAYNGKAYFFKGAQYVRYDIATDRADPGYPKSIAAGWPGVPWTDGIESAVNTGDGKVLLFKGGQYVRYDIATERADGGPFPATQFLGGAAPAAPAGGCSYGMKTEDREAFIGMVPDAMTMLGVLCGVNDKVIFDGNYIDPPALPGRRFLNFQAARCPTSGWPHGKTIKNQLTEPEKDLRSKGPHGVKEINYLVIHETGGDDTLYPNPHLVHFFIDKQGNIYQLLDLARFSTHCHNTNLSRQSIGIEVANGEGGLNFILDDKANEKRLKACKASGRCFQATPAWYMGPSTEQVDSLIRLTTWLTGTPRTSGGYTINIPRAFPTTEYAGGGKRYFLLGIDVLDDGWYHVREGWCQGSGQSWLEKRLCALGGGVVSHSVINGNGRRLDGGVLTLAAWLGAVHGYDATKAMSNVRCVLGAPPTSAASRAMGGFFNPGVEKRYPLANVYLYALDGCIDNGLLQP
jgi:hypothetical protein